jgi:hypothetical protein
VIKGHKAVTNYATYEGLIFILVYVSRVLEITALFQSCWKEATASDFYDMLAVLNF